MGKHARSSMLLPRCRFHLNSIGKLKLGGLHRHFTFVDRRTRGLLRVGPNLCVMIVLEEVIVGILALATILAVREVKKSTWRRFV